MSPMVRFLLVFLLLIFFCFISESVSAQVSPCPLQGGDRTVTICRPVVAVSYNSPIRVLAAAKHSQALAGMRVYLDGVKVFETSSDAVDTNLIVGTGSHELVVRGFDGNGSFQSTMQLQVRAHLYSRFAYVANENDHTLSTFTIESANGFVRQNGYVTAGETPSSVAETWRGFVYAAGGNDGLLYAYRKGYGGRLDPIVGSPYVCGTYCRAVAVDSTGTFAYAIDSVGNMVRGFQINAETGVLTEVPGSPFPTGGQGPSAIAISVRGIVIVTNEKSNNVIAWWIDPMTGTLYTRIGSPIAAGAAPRAAVVDPFGHCLYVANYGNNTITTYQISDTGSLSFLGPPVATGGNPVSIAVYPSGAFLYVTQEVGNVMGFRIDMTGKLAPIWTWVSGQRPMAIAFDPQGYFAFVANSGPPFELWVYKVDLSTGALHMVRGVRTRGQGTALAISGGGAPVSITPGFLYAGTADSQQFTGKIFGFSVGSNGALTPVSGSPFGHPKGVTALAVHPAGDILYAPGLKLTDHFDGTVAQYWVNRGTGALSQTAPYIHLEEFESHSMVVDPSGRFAYATSGYGVMEPWFTGWSVPATGGPLGSWLFYPGGTVEDTVSIDPTGKYAYLDGMVTAIDSQTGALSYGADYGTGHLVFDPTGRFAYGLSGDQIQAFGLSGSTGKLNRVGPAMPTGSGATMIAVDAYGRFVYVANAGSNSVSAFKASLFDGSLTAMGTFNTGTNPVSISIDATGHFLYVLNGTALSISGFSIDASTGALAQLSGSPYKMLTPGKATALVGVPHIQ